MRVGNVLSILGSAFFALSSVGASAQIAEGTTWIDVSSANGTFSAKVPCSPPEMDSGKIVVASRFHPAMSADTRLLCNRGSLSLAADSRFLSANLQGKISYFDIMLASRSPEQQKYGLPLTSVGGRRILFGERIKDKTLSETGCLEVSKSLIVFFNMTGEIGADGSADEIPDSMNRFLRSIQEISK